LEWNAARNNYIDYLDGLFATLLSQD